MSGRRCRAVEPHGVGAAAAERGVGDEPEVKPVSLISTGPPLMPPLPLAVKARTAT